MTFIYHKIHLKSLKPCSNGNVLQLTLVFPWPCLTRKKDLTAAIYWKCKSCTLLYSSAINLNHLCIDKGISRFLGGENTYLRRKRLSWYSGYYNWLLLMRMWPMLLGKLYDSFITHWVIDPDCNKILLGFFISSFFIPILYCCWPLIWFQ